MQEHDHVITRKKIFQAALIPQSVLLLISILWINILPRYNVLQYFRVDFISIACGILTGTGLAISGYGFYKFSKKIKFLSTTVELFENLLAPVFRNLNPIDIIFLSLISSLIEEIFFRGLLLPATGIIISSIAFGLLHLPGARYWIYAFWATFSGIILGYLFIVTNTLWCPIIAHMVNNIIGMFMLKKVP